MDHLNELLASRSHSRSDIAFLLGLSCPDAALSLESAALKSTLARMGPGVSTRGLIEFSNLCTCNCLYCGIRRANQGVQRYWLDEDEVLENALWCAEAGYGSVVLQAGERRDPAFIDYLTRCVTRIRKESVSATLPQGLGITLSVGEQSPETYQRWFDAGAHRYLLRIESANPRLFSAIHPPEQQWSRRVRCLESLKAIGWQLGTGVLIGLPGQTLDDLAGDILFFRELDCDMIGMGPWLATPDTPMQGQDRLSRAELLRRALNMIAVTRLLLPDVNIASTTALEALSPRGRELGLRAGANVIMPNVTSPRVRALYQLYPDKPGLNQDRGESRASLEALLASCGREPRWNQWGDSLHARRH
ncbi:MAG: [FeFe] hydrogenase H-cluster radical SAM maturase HydE [Candidatus Cloacimonetes bacterium]|nr:[FeFe] hydrogenase H-cluster radical SAM maturase HydE [Candidatus Cloacimonadota bacterium]